MNNDERKKFTMQDNEEVVFSEGPSTINDIIPKERDLTTFVDVLRKFADTSDMIANPDASLTIFAPTNSAFRKLTRKPSQVKDQSEDPTEKLYQFALGHIVPLAYSSLPDGKEIDTLKNNTRIKVKRNWNGTFKLNGRVNTISSLKAVNGFIYKIDSVLEEE
ncbi:FAS1 domain-containing protein [Glomus cerebriforme]|uniref:FAS1 domain-containing protein n=1 Tax=Glomus cerebriforme TaxID=658196 RepID=A0A397SSA1_9GLOM|nr:FAS1 domain-containing protein [Glomus cerebriforme]